MKKITSAYANKWLKSLEEDKEYWVNKEEASSTYVAAINEEPVIPEYDYAEVAATIAEIDEKIAVIKHALNVTNATAKVQVKDTEMSVDTILIKMAQLNKRKAVLDQMRKQLPKTRETTSYMSRNAVPSIGMSTMILIWSSRNMSGYLRMSWNCRWHWINITRRCSLR